MILHRVISRIALLSLFVFPGMASAAPIQGGTATYEYFNSFTTRLFPGTPFNPGTEPVDLPVESRGTFTEVWQSQAGNAMALEAVSATATGVLPGDPPVPFQILAGIQQTPQLGPFVGSYSQIVQDMNDPGYSSGAPSSLQSAHRAIAGRFAQVLANGTILYSGAPYEFVSTITGLPYPAGTVFMGAADAADVPVRVQMGAAPADTDPIIGEALSGGYFEVTKVVPEPSSATLLLLSVVTGLALFRRAGPDHDRLVVICRG